MHKGMPIMKTMKTIKTMQKFFTVIVAAVALGCFALLLSSCSADSEDSSKEITTAVTSIYGETTIELADTGIKVDGRDIATDTSSAVYSSHDIVYYEDRDTYDSGNVYGEGSSSDKHTASEAADHTVVNITKAGTYRIGGTLSLGQIAVDLGEDAKTDPEAVVTLILDNADITCSVAPCIIFYNVYECDTAYVAYSEDESLGYTADHVQDTTAAGANIILADNSENTLTGSHVAKIFKDDANEKKLHKYDGTCYSRMSMNVDGESTGDGVLNIIADNEGLDTELHLTVNGGKINIQAQNDGVNTNEDGASVTTINDGSLHIVAGLGEEGDGVDSNGYLTINGGTVIATANPAADSGLDSDMGSYVNGGYVVATGSTMDWADSESDQVTINLQFAAAQDADEAIIVTREDGTVIFAYDPDQDETTGSYNRGYLGAVVSCPSFAVGDTYYVYVGGNVDGTDVDGLYDADTVTGFNGAARQIYSGTDVGMGGPGGMGGGPGGMGGMPGGSDDMGGGPGDMGNFEDLNLDDLNLDDLGLDDLDLDGVETIEDLRELLESYLAERGIDPDSFGRRPGGSGDNREPGDNGDESNEDNSDQPNGRPNRPNDTDDTDRPDTLMPDRGEQSGETTNVRFDMNAGESNSDSAENNSGSAGNNATPNQDNPQAAEEDRPAYAFYMTDMVNSFSGVQDEG